MRELLVQNIPLLKKKIHPEAEFERLFVVNSSSSTTRCFP